MWISILNTIPNEDTLRHIVVLSLAAIMIFPFVCGFLDLLISALKKGE